MATEQANYPVTMCDPRGSSSYGKAHGRAILDDFGNLDMTDIIAYLDPRSFIGASDIGWWFAPACNTDDPARMDAQSPLLLVDQVTTPTLVLHSENDMRCPIGPARRYYAELKLAGLDVEMLVFPGETHELSRSGQPWHRRQRFDAILDWWARKL